MKLLCNVDQAECLRRGVDAPSSTVKINVLPNRLDEEQRNLIADELYDGLRFPKNKPYLCPPTPEGFFARVEYGIECKKRGEQVNGFSEEEADAIETQERKIIHQKLLKNATEEMERREEEDRLYQQVQAEELMRVAAINQSTESGPLL